MFACKVDGNGHRQIAPQFEAQTFEQKSPLLEKSTSWISFALHSIKHALGMVSIPKENRILSNLKREEYAVVITEKGPIYMEYDGASIGIANDCGDVWIFHRDQEALAFLRNIDFQDIYYHERNRVSEEDMKAFQKDLREKGLLVEKDHKLTFFDVERDETKIFDSPKKCELFLKCNFGYGLPRIEKINGKLQFINDFQEEKPSIWKTASLIALFAFAGLDRASKKSDVTTSSSLRRPRDIFCPAALGIGILGSLSERVSPLFGIISFMCVLPKVKAASGMISLSSLTGGNGFILNGEAASDLSGGSLGGAGDINGDGIDDLIVGAYGHNSVAGRSYVVFGKKGPWNSPIPLSSLTGSNGFALDGAASDKSGVSVGGAGDVNGDRIGDFFIGASSYNSYAGRSYVVFGKKSTWNSPISLSSLTGSNGFVLDGETANDQSGLSVSGAGDVNGDGIDDLIVGAYGHNANAGRSYVVFGKNSTWTSPISLSSFTGSNGFAIDGAASDNSGVSVSGAGDVNGDGIGDLFIGASGYNFQAGRSYVVFGKNGTWNSPFSLSTLTGSNGFALNGEAASDLSGYSVSDAGDINGDRIDDLTLGASGYNLGMGRSYVVFGKKGTWNSPISLSNLTGSNGYVINGEKTHDWSGFSVSGAGDINGDKINDLLIGAYRYNSNTGRSYVVFGKNGTRSSPVLLSNLTSDTGLIMDGEISNDNSGHFVSDAGDINGDGVGDLVVGAYYSNSRTGRSYAVFGNAPPRINYSLSLQANCCFAERNASYLFSFANDTFVSARFLTYNATYYGNSSWIHFDPNTSTFTGTPTIKMRLNVTVTATDSSWNGGSVSDNFQIIVNTPPTVSDISLIGWNAISFLAKDFMDHFQDKDGDFLRKVQIVSLPVNGTLSLSNHTVTLNEEIPTNQLDLLRCSPRGNETAFRFFWNGYDGDVYAKYPANISLTIQRDRQGPLVTKSASSPLRLREVK